MAWSTISRRIPIFGRNFSGRVIRINRDGSIPKDNPWLDRTTVLPETYAHGLRDPEGAAINPATGELWVTDHGPQGGDEINIIRPGRNYGWPDVSYGTQYDSQRADGRKNVPVGNGMHSMKGVEEPIYFWVPSIAPSGMMFYTGDLFPGLERQSVRWRAGGPASDAAGAQWRTRCGRREAAHRFQAAHSRCATGSGWRGVSIDWWRRVGKADAPKVKAIMSQKSVEKLRKWGGSPEPPADAPVGLRF